MALVVRIKVKVVVDIIGFVDVHEFSSFEVMRVCFMGTRIGAVETNSIIARNLKRILTYCMFKSRLATGFASVESF